MDITTPIKYNPDVDPAKISPALRAKLQQLQIYLGQQILVTSGFRTPQASVAVGGKINDAHTRGLAADIYCPTSQLAFNLIQAIIKVGFKRYGYGVNHFHVDIDSSLPQMVFWKE